MTGLRVAHVVCSEAFAGVERYVLQSALGLQQAGCEVTVVGGGRDTMAAPLSEHGIGWRPGARPAQAYRSLRGLHDLDVIVSHMTLADFTAAAAGLVSRVPVVSVRHFAAPRGTGAVNQALARLVRRRFAQQIAISHFVADNIEGSTVVVHTGVPNADEPSSREPIVLVLQRLEKEKQTEIALRAWAAAERPGEWRLVVSGEGSQALLLRELAVELGIADTVDLVGFRSDVDRLLDCASILVAPTPREGLGLSVIEAMAHGLPVVAAAAGGHLETVGAVPHAALFAVGDAQKAAKMLTELMNDPDQRRSYGRALRKAQRTSFTIAGQVAATVDVLKAAAAR